MYLNVPKRSRDSHSMRASSSLSLMIVNREFLPARLTCGCMDVWFAESTICRREKWGCEPDVRGKNLTTDVDRQGYGTNDAPAVHRISLRSNKKGFAAYNKT